MGRLRENPTRKTFSLDPTRYGKWSKIQDMQGKKYSDVLEDYMDKDIAEYEKVQVEVKTIDLSPTANLYHEESAPEDDMTNYLNTIENKFSSLLPASEIKRLQSIEPITNRIMGMFDSLINRKISSPRSPTKYNTLEKERQDSLTKGREYRKQHEYVYENPYMVSSKTQPDNETKTVKNPHYEDEEVVQDEEVIE